MLKVANLGEFDYDPAKTFKNKTKIEDILIEKAKKKGYHFITYKVDGIQYWTCCKCGFRVISEGDVICHARICLIG